MHISACNFVVVFSICLFSGSLGKGGVVKPPPSAPRPPVIRDPPIVRKPAGGGTNAEPEPVVKEPQQPPKKPAGGSTPVEPGPIKEPKPVTETQSPKKPASGNQAEPGAVKEQGSVKEPGPAKEPQSPKKPEGGKQGEPGAVKEPGSVKEPGKEPWYKKLASMTKKQIDEKGCKDVFTVGDLFKDNKLQDSDADEALKLPKEEKYIGSYDNKPEWAKRIMQFYQHCLKEDYDNSIPHQSSMTAADWRIFLKKFGAGEF